MSAVLLAGCVLAACSRTDVVAAPHADPGELATGVTLTSKLGGATLSKGIVAVSEARRGDLVWRVTKNRTRIELCRASGCVEPKAATGTELPRKNLSFLEAAERRPASERAGVWLGGGSLLPFLHHCWLQGDQPMCAPAQANGQALLALGVVATHSLRRADDIEDVVWVSLGPVLTRCRRSRQDMTCRSVIPP